VHRGRRLTIPFGIVRKTHGGGGRKQKVQSNGESDRTFPEAFRSRKEKKPAKEYRRHLLFLTFRNRTRRERGGKDRREVGKL